MDKFKEDKEQNTLNISHDDFLTDVDVAKWLGCSLWTIRRWTGGRKIPYYKIGRLVRFRRGDILDWIAKKKVGTRGL